MKRFLLIIISVLSVLHAYAQDVDSFKAVSVQNSPDSLSARIIKESVSFSSRDSLLFMFLYSVAESVDNWVPQFKLYKTENIYNLIKLNTSTGALWQVQYGIIKSSDAMEVPIDEYSLLSYDEEPIPGRYELYPTNNMYTFILLDTRKGYTYQVQWSTNPKQRFRMRIF